MEKHPTAPPVLISPSSGCPQPRPIPAHACRPFSAQSLRFPPSTLAISPHAAPAQQSLGTSPPRRRARLFSRVPVGNHSWVLPAAVPKEEGKSLRGPQPRGRAASTSPPAARWGFGTALRPHRPRPGPAPSLAAARPTPTPPTPRTPSSEAEGLRLSPPPAAHPAPGSPAAGCGCPRSGSLGSAVCSASPERSSEHPWGVAPPARPDALSPASIPPQSGWRGDGVSLWRGSAPSPTSSLGRTGAGGTAPRQGGSTGCPPSLRIAGLY